MGTVLSPPRETKVSASPLGVIMHNRRKANITMYDSEEKSAGIGSTRLDPLGAGGTRLSETPRKQSAIDEAMSRIASVGGELHEFISKLEIRLDPILGRNETKQNVRDNEVRGGLVSAIHANAETVIDANIRLSSILERLEL